MFCPTCDEWVEQRWTEETRPHAFAFYGGYEEFHPQCCPGKFVGEECTNREYHTKAAE